VYQVSERHPRLVKLSSELPCGKYAVTRQIRNSLPLIRLLTPDLCQDLGRTFEREPMSSPILYSLKLLAQRCRAWNCSSGAPSVLLPCLLLPFCLLFSFCSQSAQSKNIFEFLGFKHSIKETTASKETSSPGSGASDGDKTPKPYKYVSCQILINAPVDVVWKTVHVECDSAPDLISNNLLESSGSHSVFEQKWNVIPLVSRTTCVIDEVDYPNTRIDYKLLKSDEFKVMEGSWLFTPAQDGHATVLELTAHLEPRRHDPVVFLNAVAKRKMSKRLAHVKKLAEETKSEMKVKATVL
jgi:hypothetical protein